MNGIDVLAGNPKSLTDSGHRAVGAQRRSGKGPGLRARRGRLRHEAVRHGGILARIRTAIRHRLQSAGIHPLLRVGTLEIDLTSHHVRRNNVEIQLTRTEFSLLRLFVEHPNKVLTHEFILRAIRGRYDPRDSQYLRVYMRALRSKIEDPTAGKKIIETVTGVGYRLANEQAAGSAAS
jgi:DNA-binding response OmpR family regulator